MIAIRYILILVTVVAGSGVCAGASRKPVRAKAGMVVSAESLASEAGVAVLKRGGNAIDAAVAVGFVLAVTYPEAGNIGGGGFMLIRLADGKETTIDFRELAPGAAHRNMFLDSTGNIIPGASEQGVLAAGIPGTVAGFLHALEQYGTLDRAAVLDPAITLAGHGFRVDSRLATSLRRFGAQFQCYSSSAKGIMPGGRIPIEGDAFRQLDLAYTLRTIRDQGRDGFYKGRVADLLVAEIGRGGGIITHDDLENYRVAERSPLIGSYRDHRILTASLPSGGGMVLLQILNMLERFNIRESGSTVSPSLFKRYIFDWATTKDRHWDT